MRLELSYNAEKEQTEQERKSYCASISSIFPLIEKDIKAKMYEQLIPQRTRILSASKKIADEITAV